MVAGGPGNVERLRTSDWRALVGVAADLVDCEELTAVAATVMDGAGKLVGCDISACFELDVSRSDVVVREEGPERYPSWVRPGFTPLAQQNPLIAHSLRTGETRALRLSDFADNQRLHRLELYERIYRPMGIEHQLACVFPLTAPGSQGGRVVRVSLSRQHRDFTERDRAVLDHLAPFARRAYHDAYVRVAVGQGLNGDIALALTEREREVLAGVTKGQTNSQIAADLHISRHTVAKHLQNIYAKLGVQTRTAAAHAALSTRTQH